MKITYLGHSAVQLVLEGFCIPIDPALSGNSPAPLSFALHPDVILTSTTWRRV
ncbi:MAG TPA: hypothetical protein V6C82_05710 [Chroococcales cyanobacterium]